MVVLIIQYLQSKHPWRGCKFNYNFKINRYWPSNIVINWIGQQLLINFEILPPFCILIIHGWIIFISIEHSVSFTVISSHWISSNKYHQYIFHHLYQGYNLFNLKDSKQGLINTLVTCILEQRASFCRTLDWHKVAHLLHKLYGNPHLLLRGFLDLGLIKWPCSSILDLTKNKCISTLNNG